jgi:hypothetical protein
MICSPPLVSIIPWVRNRRNNCVNDISNCVNTGWYEVYSQHRNKRSFTLHNSTNMSGLLKRVRTDCSCRFSLAEGVVDAYEINFRICTWHDRWLAWHAGCRETLKAGCRKTENHSANRRLAAWLPFSGLIARELVAGSAGPPLPRPSDCIPPGPGVGSWAGWPGPFLIRETGARVVTGFILDPFRPSLPATLF